MPKSFYLLFLTSLGFTFFAFKNKLIKDEDFHQHVAELLENSDSRSVAEMVASKDFTLQFEASSCLFQGRINHLLGKFYYNQNDESKAIEYFKKAVYENWYHCAETIPTEKANTMYNIGISYQYTHEMPEGRKFLDSAFLIINKISQYPKDELALKYQGAGSYFSELQDFYRAESYYRNAATLSANLEDIDAFYLYIEWAALYLKFKKLAEAEAVYNLIEKDFMRKSKVLTSTDKAVYFLNLAELNYLKKKPLMALNFCRSALSLLDEEELDLQSNAYEIMGSVYHDVKKFDESKRHFEWSYQCRMKTNNLQSAALARAFSLENLAELEWEQKKMDRALQFVNEAMKSIAPGLAFDANENPIIETSVNLQSAHLIRELLLKSMVLFDKDQLGNKVDTHILSICLNIHRKIDTLTHQLVNISPFDQSIVKILDEIPAHTDQAIKVCLELFSRHKDENYIKDALSFYSNSRSLALRKLINNNKRFSNNVDNQTKSQYLKLSKNVNETQQLILEKEGNLDSLQKVFTEHQVAMASFLEKYNALQFKNVEQFSLSEFKSQLTKKSAVIAIHESKDAYVIFYILESTMDWKTINKSKVDPIVNVIKETLQDPQKNYNKDAAQQIFNLLFNHESIKERLGSNIGIVADGQFSNLPMEALMDNSGKYAVESFNFTYAYSPGMLIGNEKKYKSLRKFTGFATNYSSQINSRIIDKGIQNDVGSIQPLLHATKELIQCSKLVKGSCFYENAAAVDSFIKYAPESEILYLSLHSISDTLEGSNSVLLFDDRNHNFLLRSSELYQQPLNNKLVILSACNSADGASHQTEGMIGMSRSFLGSGANNVVSALWPVSENASQHLLPEFLKHFLNSTSPAQALSEAKRNYINVAPPSQQHPYYWANFILFGPLEEVNPSKFFSVYFIAIGFLLFLVLVWVIIYLKMKKRA